MSCSPSFRRSATMPTAKPPISLRSLPRAMKFSRCPPMPSLSRPRYLHVTAKASSATPSYATAFHARDVHTKSFPCTLHYYSPRGPSLLLYDHADGKEAIESSEELYRLHTDAVVVHSDGLVYPGPAALRIWNGLYMLPNTLLMQQIITGYLDWYETNKEMNEKIATPYIFTIPKGTPIPSDLFLVNEKIEVFHLMPREGMALSALNKTLNAFFASYGSRLPMDEWHKKYEFLEGYNTYAESEWMSR